MAAAASAVTAGERAACSSERTQERHGRAWWPSRARGLLELVQARAARRERGGLRERAACSIERVASGGAGERAGSGGAGEHAQEWHGRARWPSRARTAAALPSPVAIGELADSEASAQPARASAQSLPAEPSRADGNDSFLPNAEIVVSPCLGFKGQRRFLYRKRFRLFFKSLSLLTRLLPHHYFA